jgi:hypothetical protein
LDKVIGLGNVSSQSTSRDSHSVLDVDLLQHYSRRLLQYFQLESIGSVAECTCERRVEDTDDLETFPTSKGLVDVLALDAALVGPDEGGDDLVVGAVHLADGRAGGQEPLREGDADGVARSVVAGQRELDLVGGGLAHDLRVQRGDGRPDRSGGSGDGRAGEDHLAECLRATGSHARHHQADGERGGQRVYRRIGDLRDQQVLLLVIDGAKRDHH